MFSVAVGSLILLLQFILLVTFTCQKSRKQLNFTKLEEDHIQIKSTCSLIGMPVGLCWKAIPPCKISLQLVKIPPESAFMKKNDIEKGGQFCLNPMDYFFFTTNRIKSKPFIWLDCICLVCKIDNVVKKLLWTCLK